MTQEIPPTTLHVLQQDSAILGSILNKLKELHSLHKILANYLDAKLASRCSVSNLEENCLTVVTESALWATPFRFQIPVLIEKLKQHTELSTLSKIICKIRPAQHKPKPPAASTERLAPRLSAQTGEMISTIAATINDEKLKAVMLNIAKHTHSSFHSRK
jgi:hypothetical protein